jgi:hypothetical protein
MAGASGVAAFGVLVDPAVVVRLLTEDATRHILQVALAAEADRLMAEAGPMRTALLTAVNQELRPSPGSADAAVSGLRSPPVIRSRVGISRSHRGTVRRLARG